MGRLDKRTSDEENDRLAREAAERRSVSREQQLREAQAAAERTAAQETLVEEIHALVDELLEFMESLDYPDLQTITLPMTRWWWPFARPTRKAVWKLLHKEAQGTRSTYGGYVNEISEQMYKWWEDIYLLPEVGLWYHEQPIFSGGRTQDKVVSREWQGEDAKEVKKKLKELIRQYSR